ncbi:MULTISPECIES: hypothetical protein [unclassified Polaromonas]|uniref:hypothetical protein n=1 Tax=unclassified Polaromonas TaxID=2638319 RepID=UPI0025CC039C|nr:MULTISPECIES: hypothetical protein [unclassified Polaromonas]HQR98145.1 hypothetical protein [Polaromonas sp.]HQS38852.1 hypothetical protein [Polaromonas sp.]HQS88105.1 hypothetical protein [Polaromonas sp.]
MDKAAIRAELMKFTDHAQKKGMSLAGDYVRFFNQKTAMAWTKWLAAPRDK